MAKKNNNIGVDNLTENAFVADMESSKERESNLSYNAATKKKWDKKSIISYHRTADQTDDLFASIDIQTEEESLRVENGENKVKMLGCELWTNNDTKKQFLRFTLKDEKTGAKFEVSLFPGNTYTDMQGKKIDAGHNWLAFKDEVIRQRNSAGKVTRSGMNFTQVLREYCTEGFTTWILWDGKYTNIYATERKYQNAIDRLAKEQKKGK